MSARLSRRFANVAGMPAFAELRVTEHVALASLTERRDVEFEHLPERYQRLILAAEREKWGDRAEEMIVRQFGAAPGYAQVAATR